MSTSERTILVRRPVRMGGIDYDEMVQIPAGKFLFGKNNEERHVDDFYIDKYAVTNKQYREFLEHFNQEKTHGQCHKDEPKKKDHTPAYWDTVEYTKFSPSEEHPLIYIDWYDAYSYTMWKGKRLLTEIEWEKAARGTDGRAYPWGDEFDPEKCNTVDSGIGITTPVSKYEIGRSPFGCYDMSGNVWEWTEDLLDVFGRYRVVRGGCYRHSKQLAHTAYRSGYSMEYNEKYDPGCRHNYIGFRCGKDYS